LESGLAIAMIIRYDLFRFLVVGASLTFNGVGSPRTYF